MDEAYTPLPRQYQQDVVDQTFRSVSRAPRAQQAASKLGNFLAESYQTASEGKPELREQGVQQAEIVNPRHWIWQMTRPLLRKEVAEGLENAPGLIKFRDVPQGLMSRMRALGATWPEPIGRPGFPNVPRNVEVGIAPKAMQQNIGEVTGIHELTGHALPLTTTGQPMSYSPAGGMQVVRQELEHPSLAEHTPEYLARLLARMRGVGGPPHAAIELSANRQAVEAGVNPLIRQLKDVPEDVVTSNLQYLRQLLTGAK